MRFLDIFKRIQKEKPPAPPKEREPEATNAGLNDSVGKILHEVQGITSKLEQHDKKTDQGFADLSRSSEKLLQQFQQLFPVVPTTTKETLHALSNIGESHKRLINAVLTQEIPENQLTYEELSEKLGMKQSSVRGIVHDLRQVGFEFTTGRVGKRVAIGLSKDLLQQLLVEKN
jgi:biotin operon repressor